MVSWGGGWGGLGGFGDADSEEGVYWGARVKLINDLAKIQKIETSIDWEDDDENMAEHVSQYLGEVGEVLTYHNKFTR